MKQILIPTDFSPNSWNTLKYASNLYKNVSCKFHIVNTYEVPSSLLSSTVSSQKIGHLYDAVKKVSEKKLELLFTDIDQYLANPKHIYETISKPGAFVKVVQQMTIQTLYDMIVIGTKGATGAKEVFIGSNTQNLVKHIHNCPILIIPESVSFTPISEIAFATDFERIFFKSEIVPIIDLAKRCNATIRMIHVYDEPKLSEVQHYNSSSLERYFKNLSYDFHVIQDFSTIEKAIEAFIEELDIDVLVMIKYPHSFIEQLTREAIIKKITFHIEIPFLVIPSDD
ncbi:universal stress protein [Aquimarina sp. 2201CG1-2-11]|uniref:universal stress protein n=1 Tax=Aquimarina discodermiae TaxID=3231043 RepID=UPI0034622A67